MAISDDARRMAVPRDTIPASNDWIAQVAEIVTDADVAEVVVGLPLSLSGEEGPAAQRVRLQAEELGAKLDVPVRLQDERLSTVEATRRLGGAQVRGAKRKAVVDAAAATVILETFLARGPVS